MKTLSRHPALLFSGLAAVLASIFLLSGGPARSGTGMERPHPHSGRQAAERKSARPSGNASSSLIGLRLDSADAPAAKRWAEALSRNEHEFAQRLADLKHLKRAEVIRFGSIAANADRLSVDQLPVTLSLPYFGGSTLDVEFDHLSIDGPEGGTLAGRVVGQPETFVVLGFHNGETSGIVEGPDKIAFLDAFDGETVILRELDAAAHASDFECDCLRHRAAAAAADCRTHEKSRPGFPGRLRRFSGANHFFFAAFLAAFFAAGFLAGAFFAGAAFASSSAAWAAARRATGTRYGEQDT